MSFVEDLRSAAVQGDAEAQSCLGFCYETGDGVEKNYKKAIYWYTKAAELGDIEAQFNLGLCYKNGKGVKKSNETAAFWWAKACRTG